MFFIYLFAEVFFRFFKIVPEKNKVCTIRTPMLLQERPKCTETNLMRFEWGSVNSHFEKIIMTFNFQIKNTLLKSEKNYRKIKIIHEISTINFM